MERWAVIISHNIIFLTGSVHSRSLWDLFNLLFGDKADSEKQNKIPGDDEDYKGRKPVDKPAGSMENNEIIVKNPRTHKKWNTIDRRVGWTYSARNDPRTSEGYRLWLEEMSQYLGNLSGQDHGRHHLDYYYDFDEDDLFDYYEWDPDNPPEDPDYSETSDYSYDSDFEFDHDELRV
ncbi:unnamed protein product [Cylicocyclus nassatus]|uniref:Uncharacterized protein n=1 Tax=Cylicocyclus nassatus TaxID=53992 RepID=A0AA36MC64_CYLNA|nr:unnamed protein product [Cylicocyclus nassatus]